MVTSNSQLILPLLAHALSDNSADSMFTGVLDACILRSRLIRGLFVQLAIHEMFEAKWSDDIREEVVHGLAQSLPGLQKRNLLKTWTRMETALPNARVIDYDHLVPRLWLPDPSDRHVLAAAIKANAGVIVTANLKHFPSRVLAAHNIIAVNQDKFLMLLLDINFYGVCHSIRTQREDLWGYHDNVEQFLIRMKGAGLPMTVARLKEHADLL